MAEKSEQRLTSEQSESADIRRIESDELFRGQKMLVIRHAGEDYRLILTRNNRLILQK